jgi:hypothetical protein
MNRALWLLLGLQMRGWLRFLARRVRTLKGALLALVGLAVFVPWLLTLLLAPGSAGGIAPEAARRYGPAMLLAYCVLNVVFSSGERALYFSPAEVNFLFPGPFGRREVLAYKIALALLVGLPTTLLLALVVRVRDARFLASFVSYLLLYVFLQLFGMALGLLAAAVGARLYTRGRRLALAGAAVLAVALLLQAGGPGAGGGTPALLERALDTRLWRALALPLGWFFEAMLARDLWPDLVLYAVLASLVNLALVGAIFGLDAQYQEGAAVASARLYARLQRLRGRNVDGGEAVAPAGKRRAELPALPWWGGVGPILWRQLTTASRGLGRLAVALVVLGAMLLAPLLSGNLRDEGALLGVGVGMVFWLTLFLTVLVPFDFRGDLDRMALLKTLPLPAWRLTVGQLLTPVLLLCVLEWLALAALLAVVPVRLQGWLVAGAAFVPPSNFLLIALDNLLFLLFPVRLMASTPGDFQALGRNALLALAKAMGLGAVGTAAALTGAFVWLVTANPWFGVAAAWPVVACGGAALVPAIGLAFERFDVGRDTPA